MDARPTAGGHWDASVDVKVVIFKEAMASGRLSSISRQPQLVEVESDTPISTFEM